MRAYAHGACMRCGCKEFRCPQCGEELRLLDAEDDLHMGICTLCGPIDDYCRPRPVSRSEILSALPRTDG